MVPRGVLAAFLLILPIPAHAAEPTRDAPPASPATGVAFPSQVEEVFVTVTVTDKSGRPVTDVKPEEFLVTENGRPL